MNKFEFKSYLESVGVLCSNPAVDPHIIDWLDEKGYFTSPASSRFHRTSQGDLCRHSMEVAEILATFTDQLRLTWTRPASPWIVGLFHDVCKMDNYIPVDPAESSDGRRWDYNSKQLLKGHGEKSVMLLSQFMILTEEEILCIRYHMGAYNKEDWKGFDLAIRKYPNVLFTHTADMLASKAFNI